MRQQLDDYHEDCRTLIADGVTRPQAHELALRRLLRHSPLTTDEATELLEEFYERWAIHMERSCNENAARRRAWARFVELHGVFVASTLHATMLSGKKRSA